MQAFMPVPESLPASARARTVNANWIVLALRWRRVASSAQEACHAPLSDSRVAIPSHGRPILSGMLAASSTQAETPCDQPLARPAVSLLVSDLDNTLWDWVEIWYRSF